MLQRHPALPSVQCGKLWMSLSPPVSVYFIVPALEWAGGGEADVSAEDE